MLFLRSRRLLGKDISGNIMSSRVLSPFLLMLSFYLLVLSDQALPSEKDKGKLDFKWLHDYVFRTRVLLKGVLPEKIQTIKRKLPSVSLLHFCYTMPAVT